MEHGESILVLLYFIFHRVFRRKFSYGFLAMAFLFNECQFIISKLREE